MKALILAAGLGTRLRPFTHMTPKALFTINGQPLLGAAIEKLSRAGFEGVLVNTHHHHTQIETYLADTSFPIPVAACHEPDILGTGGAIRNVSGLWDDDPLLVINADIVTDLDPAEIYRFHRSHGFPVTMVMHDSPNFNSVDVSDDDFVLQFGCRESEDKNHRVMAFTGIHVLDRRVLDFLPAQGPAHIIDAYGRMLEAGEKIKAYVARNHYWQDIGTPERYQQAVFDRMAPMAFKSAFGIGPEGPIHQHRLHGDGSDRQWYRLEAHGRTLIMVEHGIRNDHGTQEVDAYVHIGRHLAAKAVAVPKIHLNDNFAGVVFLEDLGDEHLQRVALQCDEGRRLELYRSVIDQWVTMAIEGSRDFDPSWTYQTARYDRDVILDKECRYFVEAFVQGHLGWPVTYADLRAEFEKLADDILDSELSGFVHRDFQSRNIMVQKDRIGVIDFQGGRLGPIQYDLASLLIDPYTALTEKNREQLKAYALAGLECRSDVAPHKFEAGFRACAISRNLQILGAFAFLSRVKGKTGFLQYIPQAAQTLSQSLSRMDAHLPTLTMTARKIADHTAQMP